MCCLEAERKCQERGLLEIEEVGDYAKENLLARAAAKVHAFSEQFRFEDSSR